MFEGLRRNIGILWTRFLFRHDRDPVINFSEAFPRATRAVVIYPVQPIEQESTSLMLSYLSERFADGLTVVVRQELRSSLLSLPRLRMVTYNADDVTKWFTPRSSLVRRMKTMSFDIAVDLNAQFSLVSAFLCKASRAPVRVSFAKERGERFFNVEYQSRGNGKRQRHYQGFVRCLQMFDRT